MRVVIITSCSSVIFSVLRGNTDITVHCDAEDDTMYSDAEDSGNRLLPYDSVSAAVAI